MKTRDDHTAELVSLKEDRHLSPIFPSLSLSVIPSISHEVSSSPLPLFTSSPLQSPPITIL